jgi:hypothetical protein
VFILYSSICVLHVKIKYIFSEAIGISLVKAPFKVIEHRGSSMGGFVLSWEVKIMPGEVLTNLLPQVG